MQHKIKSGGRTFLDSPFFVSYHLGIRKHINNLRVILIYAETVISKILPVAKPVRLANVFELHPYKPRV